MTQFQPPPYPPQLGEQRYSPAAHAGSAPPRWSAAAISAFVLSLLGFLGITAILGIIFGVVGIITTGPGRRRGRGLAVAAIPISFATGALSVLLFTFIFFLARAATLPGKLQSALGSSSVTAADSASALRELGSSAFNTEVSTEALQAWLTQIIAKHGKLTSAAVDRQQVVATTPDGAMVLNIQGKFVNGPAAIRLIISQEEVWALRIDDIDIGGSSPRSLSKNSREATKNEPASATP